MDFGHIRVVEEESLKQIIQPFFTTGDFRNRPLAQNIDSNFGKILKINTQTKKTDIVSLGHRNPQGLYYSKKFDFILSTEHGPKGGDEININIKPFLKVKNFGWPISSYGDHYAKHYSQKILDEAPLNKSHKKFDLKNQLNILIHQLVLVGYFFKQKRYRVFNWGNGK